MTQEEAIEYLKTEGYDLFHIEDRPTKIIIAGCRNEQRGKCTSLRTGNCMNAPDMMVLSISGTNRKTSKKN